MDSQNGIKTIDYSDWTPFGKGGRGTTYRKKDDPSIILKMDNRADEMVVREEFELSRKVAELGISTPQVYEMVTDGKLFGYTAQLIKGKKSVCRIISEHPSRMDEMVRLFTDRALQFHTVKCDTSEFQGMKQRALDNIAANRYLTDATKEAILSDIRSIPDTGTCLLGDFHFGNLITTGEKDYWIDLGEFTHGNPVFDIARFGFSLELPSIATDHLFHLDNKQMSTFFEKFLDCYAAGVESQTGIGREEFLLMVRKAGQASRVGVMMNGILAFLFLPRLQRYRGDKPSSRLAILWKLITGRKLY